MGKPIYKPLKRLAIGVYLKLMNEKLLHYRLIISVAEHFEQAYQKWKRRVESGDLLSRSPKWSSIHETFPGHIKYWRAEADRLHIELYGRQPDF